MSQRGVEIVLGRLATDSTLRRRFARAPDSTLHELMAEGIELSRVEIDALILLPGAALQTFANALDPRLRRAVLIRK